MSEFPDPTGVPEERASREHSASAESSASFNRGPARDHGPSDELNKEIEEAMAAMSDDELAELTGKAPRQQLEDDASGSRRRAKIVGIYENDVFIDLGGKSQGVVARSQFGKEEVLEIGSEVEVVIERYDADSGLLITSRDGAVREAHWDSLTVGTVVEGRITGMNKGGLEVNLNGIRGFMPASHVDVAHVKDISIFLGQKVLCEILELNRRARNVLLSRRKVVQREQQERKKTLLDELAPGQVRKGVVGNLTDFGAFVDLGGIDGLIHISDLSYRQVNRVSDVLEPGQTVEVKVLKVDKKRERISLGLKQVKPDPWAGVGEQYPVDTKLTVRVLRLERFGAFVELEEGVDGLIPMSEMSWSRIGRLSDVLQVGQTVEAVVIRVEPEKRRIALSLKQVEADPWAGVLESFPKNSTITGRVTKCTDFGAFVELVPGVEGLVHISELSDQRVKKCEDVVQPGQEVEVRVLDVDTEQRRISLSVKAAQAAAQAPPEEGAPQAEKQQPKKKRKRPLRGGLASHFEWLGKSIGS